MDRHYISEEAFEKIYMFLTRCATFLGVESGIRTLQKQYLNKIWL